MKVNATQVKTQSPAEYYLSVIWDFLDVIASREFKGGNMLFGLDAIHAQPERFQPGFQLLVDLASVCPKELRSKLAFRGGEYQGLSQHAGQKEKINARYKETPRAEAKPKTNIINLAPMKKKGYGDYIRGAIRLIKGQASDGLDCQELSALMKLKPTQTSMMLRRLFSSKRVCRLSIASQGKGSPKFRYFIDAKASAEWTAAKTSSAVVSQ